MSKTFLGGVPTGIDVRRLDEVFADLAEGAEVTHEQVEAALGIGRAQTRYRTVTVAWRRSLLNDRNIELAAVPGIGFRVLAASERLNASVKGFRQGVRKQMRSVRRSDMVRTDDPILMRKQEVMRRAGMAIARESASMMKEIEPPKAQQQMPRLVPNQSAA